MAEMEVVILPREVSQGELGKKVKEMEEKGWSLISQRPTITLTFEREVPDPPPAPPAEDLRGDFSQQMLDDA